MVEVFKTDVIDANVAEMLVMLIHKTFDNYNANFDLDDCDNILRIECAEEIVIKDAIISLLKLKGFTAEVLADEFIPVHVV
jgi:hypothetical protein